MQRSPKTFIPADVWISLRNKAGYLPLQFFPQFEAASWRQAQTQRVARFQISRVCLQTEKYRENRATRWVCACRHEAASNCGIANYRGLRTLYDWQLTLRTLPITSVERWLNML